MNIYQIKLTQCEIALKEIKNATIGLIDTIENLVPNSSICTFIRDHDPAFKKLKIENKYTIGETKMSTFQDKMPIVKEYLLDLISLQMMRSQIPGNEMSDQERLALALFRKCKRETQLEIANSIVDNFDTIIMNHFCNIIIERAPKLVEL